MSLTNQNKVRIGMIGAGEISAYHLHGLAATGMADIRVIMSRTAEAARTIADENGIDQISTNIDEVLGRDDIDAVVIATPDHTHMDFAIQSLQAGKAVLLQKPMGRDVVECQAVIDAASRSDAQLSVSFMHRYLEEVQAVRQILAEGKMGRILSARIRNATPGPNWNDWFFFRKNVGGGVVKQLGVHGIDLVRYVLGEIVSLSATCSIQRPERVLLDGRVVHPDNEDHAVAHYKLENGADVTHEISFNELSGTDRFRMEIYCEEGTLLLRTQRGRLAIFAPKVTGQNDWVIPELAQSPFGQMHHRHWLNVFGGAETSEGTAQAGLEAVKIADAIYTSNERKEWVEV
ncbi:hypothetical protein A9Q83_11490 [Alphaproteobacteria bacterium 46_93_T64]|nr:hypothetical protein A9Q83_11490 [Alphaproteobacteria bacterium 46_93_T64]